MLRLLHWISIGAVIILASLACQISAPTRGEEQPGEVLFRDDFSDPTSGWNRVDEDKGLTDYDDGVYRIYVNEANTDIWTRPGLDFTDVRIEVDTFKVAGDRDNRFGIICRLTDSDFYTFIISSDGYYGIGKIKGEEYELIGMDALQPTDAIELGAAVNHIRADCVGSTLALFVNGQQIAEVQDLEFTSGDVGLIVGTYDNPGTDIRFDNFIVVEP